MWKFRLAIGNASCKELPINNSNLLQVCTAMKEKIDYLKSLSKQQIEKWNDYEVEEIEIGETTALLTVFKDRASENRDLIVVQAFYPTWKHANYFSIGKVGRIVADGFFIDSDCKISEASDDDLWQYR